MRYPLLLLAVAFILGILFSNTLYPSIIYTFIVSAILLIIIFLLYLKSRIFLSFLFSVIAFFYIGHLVCSINHENHCSNQLRKLWEEKKESEFSQPVEIFGVINQSPEKRWNMIYLKIKLHKIASSKGCYKIDGGIRLRVRLWSPHFANLRQLEYGDYIRTITRLYEPHNYMNEGCFNYKGYLTRQGVYLIGSVESPLLIDVLRKGEANPVIQSCQKIRSKLSHKIDYYFSSGKGQLTQEGALIKSITLGQRSMLNKKFSDKLRKSGTFHILAISGLHIFIISYFLFYLLNFFNIPERANCLMIIVFLLFYTVFTGGRIPVLRATIMTTIYLIGRVLYKESNMLNSLCLACLVILLYKPDQLFDAGFQLSFSATFFIIILAPKLINLIGKRPFKLGEIFSITLAAQVGLIPILIYHFHHISFISVISNLVAFPLIWFTIILGFLFLFFSYIFPAVAEILAVTSQYLIKVFYYLLTLLNKIPYSHHRVPTPFFWLFLFYYCSLLLFIIFGWKKKIGIISLAAWLLFLLIIVTSPFPPSFSPHLRVNFLDVGRGDAILIEFPGREKMLLDGGGFSNNITYIGEYVISPYLWNKRIKQIDIVALSHAHVDHLGGLLSVVDNFKIKQIWQGNPPENNWYYERFIKKSKDHKIAITNIYEDFNTNINGVNLKILNPPKRGAIPNKELNNNSLVLMLSYGKHKILLTADIEAEVEKELIEQYGNELRCQVLKASHHGSTTSNTEEFLTMVQPKIAIISGWNLSFNEYKNHEIINRLCQKNCRVLRTSKHGRITLISDGTYIEVKTYSQNQ